MGSSNTYGLSVIDGADLFDVPYFDDVMSACVFG